MKNKMQNWYRISRMHLGAAALTFAAAVVMMLITITAQSAQAQTYTVLASFDGMDGNYPVAPLVQATNGNLYGTTYQNGFGYGTVFDITTSGTLTSLYAFCAAGPPCTGGYGPVAGLVQVSNGDLYSTTEYGGPSSAPLGTVFKITPDGTLTTLDGFAIGDGSGPYPTAGLIQASNGDLYGATVAGGINGGGTLFKLTPAGKLSTIYNFCPTPDPGECDPGSLTSFDGYDPVAGLIQATNGDMYGTTVAGGINNGGTIFKTTAGGVLTVLYRFCSQMNGQDCTDGANPASVLVQATNGNFYGTTAEGGTGAACPVFYGCGTVFEITPAGIVTTLYNFCSQSGCADGQNGGSESQQPALIQGSDGNLYGTTTLGGANGDGTIFELTTTGTLTTLYNFCSQTNCADGGRPDAGLIQDTNGAFYGTTSVGVAGNPCYEYGCGTVFSLSTGLGPFVQAVPNSSKGLATVNILGTDLTGSTSVTFNGVAAAFTVVSSSDITATIPAGATTGYVTVTTSSGTLTSNVPEIVGGKLISTTTVLSSSPNPSISGEAVTFTAVVDSNAGAPPSGETVSFMNGATLLGTGVLSGGSASFTISTLAVGKTSVKALYSGDAYFKDSSSTVVKQVVDN